MTTFREQVVVLRIANVSDGTVPAEWDWRGILDGDDVQVLASGPVSEYEVEWDGDGRPVRSKA